MDAENFLSKLREQAAVIKAAPYPFVLAVAIVGVGVWSIVNWGYSTVISSKNSQLEFADRQIADYKEKLGGASPDQAKARMEALEKEVGSLKQQVKPFVPRRLTDDQRRLITESARPGAGIRPEIRISDESGCPDCSQLAADFERALRDANWEVRNSFVMGPRQRPASGIGLVVQNPASLSAVENLLRTALHQAQIEVDLLQGPATVMVGPPGRTNGLELLLTTRGLK
jgi:hypothetical protein